MNKAFNATADGQKAMASHASRISLLMALNTKVRSLNPSEAWSDEFIQTINPESIDSTRDDLIVCYNRLLEANKTNTSL